MSKSKNKKELDDLQRLKYENKALKRQISRLNKQLSRLDLDRYQNLQEIVEVQCKEEQDLHKKTKRQLLLEKWACFDCRDEGEEGYLRLIIINRPDGVFYLRRCRECGRKTKLQKYNNTVSGIIE